MGWISRDETTGSVHTQGKEKHIHHPAGTERLHAVPGRSRTWVYSTLDQTMSITDKSYEWDVDGSLCRGTQVLPFLFVSTTAAPQSFAGLRHRGQRQGRKLCLPQGKCQPWSLKGQNLGWHLVATFAHHSQLKPLRWPNSEAISQSVSIDFTL